MIILFINLYSFNRDSLKFYIVILLGNNKIGIKGAVHIAKALEKNSSLTTLHLSKL